MSRRTSTKGEGIFPPQSRRCGHSAWSSGHHAPSAATRGLVVSVVAWSLAWKGASLWRAANEGSKPWFITLLISNTAGVLDAIYLFGVSTPRRRRKQEARPALTAAGDPDELGRQIVK
jgi:hypothetical protein